MSARTIFTCDTDDRSCQIGFNSEDQTGYILARIDSSRVEVRDGVQYLKTPLNQGDAVVLRDLLDAMPWP